MLLNYNDYNKILQKLDELTDELTKKKINLKYINILLACKIYKEERNKLNKLSSNNLISTIFPNCEKMLKTTVKKSPYFGYIISSNKNIDGNISEIFIEKLLDAIKNFIVPLHNASYVLNNINVNNILWAENEVYFNIDIEKMTENTDNNKDFISLKKYILNLFDSFNFSIRYRFMKLINNLTYNDFMSELNLNNIHSIYIIYTKYNTTLKNSIISYYDKINEISNKYYKAEYKYSYLHTPIYDGKNRRYADRYIVDNKELVKEKLDESRESGELKDLKDECNRILNDCITEENYIFKTAHIIIENDFYTALRSYDRELKALDGILIY